MKKEVKFLSLILSWDQDEKYYTDTIRISKEEILFLMNIGKLPELSNTAWIPESIKAEAIVHSKDIKDNHALVTIIANESLAGEPDFLEENKALIDVSEKKIKFSFEVEEGFQYDVKENCIFVIHV